MPNGAADLRHADDTGRHSEPDTRLAAAFESVAELHLLATPIAGLEFTLDLLGQLVPCEAISGCLYDIDTDEFRFVALSGPGAMQRKASAISSSAGLFGVAHRERREVLVIPDVNEERRFNPNADGRPGLSAHNLAYVPVRQHGQLLGMLQLINRDRAKGFSQSDVSVLSYVAGQLGEFLSNCRALTE